MTLTPKMMEVFSVFSDAMQDRADTNDLVRAKQCMDDASPQEWHDLLASHVVSPDCRNWRFGKTISQLIDEWNTSKSESSYDLQPGQNNHSEKSRLLNYMDEANSRRFFINRWWSNLLCAAQYIPLTIDMAISQFAHIEEDAQIGWDRVAHNLRQTLYSYHPGVIASKFYHAMQHQIAEYNPFRHASRKWQEFKNVIAPYSPITMLENRCYDAATKVGKVVVSKNYATQRFALSFILAYLSTKTLADYLPSYLRMSNRVELGAIVGAVGFLQYGLTRLQRNITKFLRNAHIRSIRTNRAHTSSPWVARQSQIPWQQQNQMAQLCQEIRTPDSPMRGIWG